jgi:hypothetical protein
MSPRDQLSRRIAPGIWEDVQGNPHWSIPELLELMDLEDTPENRARVLDTIREVERELKQMLPPPNPPISLSKIL